ncbi:Melanoma antigen preferentially expressed in tumors [Plecturocebus cupreus]
MKMDQQVPATLLELAAWGLLSEEPEAIHALEELPWGLYVPLFIIAFLGGQKMKLKAMVKIWPSRCLRVGPLSVQSHATKSWEPRLMHSILKREEAKRSVRVLLSHLYPLYVSLCGLSTRDITVLSQNSQVTHLKLLSPSNNQVSWEVSRPFLALLEKVSQTLQHLEIDNCLITDFTFSVVTPALSHCSHLCVPIFAFNPITMAVLTGFLQHLTAWMELKYVIYPVPVRGYERWRCRGSLDMKAR